LLYFAYGTCFLASYLKLTAILGETSWLLLPKDVKGKGKVASGGVQHGRGVSEEPHSDDNKDGDDAKCDDEEVDAEDWFTLPIADWCTLPTRKDSELDDEVCTRARTLARPSAHLHR
jgi:hypothetical protein